VSTRRIGTETSKTRAALLDATERLLLAEGYAAVSSRRVAAAVGVKPPLVHYYFPSMDDLFVALLRRGADANFERQERALESATPLRALWQLASDRMATSLMTELMALGAHRPVVRAEIAAYAERFRAAQITAVTAIFSEYDIDATAPDPAALMFMMTSVSVVVELEQSLGITCGHRETLEFVERLLQEFEGNGRTRQGARVKRSRR
jgi:AcrR family transcriptional regulator